MDESVKRDINSACGADSVVAGLAFKYYKRSGKHVGKNATNRSKLLYGFVYNAYINCEIPINPTELGEKFGLSKKKSSNVGKNEAVSVDCSVYLVLYLEQLEKHLQISESTRELIVEMGKMIDEDPIPFTSQILAICCICAHVVDDEWAGLRGELLKSIGQSQAKLDKCMKILLSYYGSE